MVIFWDSTFIFSISVRSRSAAALSACMSRVLGHKNELFRMTTAVVSVNERAECKNPVIFSVSVSTHNTTSRWEPFKGKRNSLKSDKEWEAFTPIIQVPLLVRLGSVVISMVVAWVPTMFLWP